MKNILKKLVVLLVVFLNIVGVNAASASKTIDKNACETVYTNYYLLLEANSKDYFNNAANPYSLVHENRGNYVNNVWRTDFDSNNVGYGVISLSTTTTSSTDKLSKWTLSEYYTYLGLATGSYNGNYINGNDTYITNHTSESKNTNGRWVQNGYGLDARPITTNQYINATYDATATISNVSSINPNTVDFTIYIKRTGFKNYASKTPVTIDNVNWLFNPQVFYVQYCTPKEVEKTITYNANAGSDSVSNLPSKQTFTGDKTTLSKNIPTRKGYTFVGWAKSKDSNSTLYEKGAEYIGDSTTLYAIWSYKVIYEGNASGVSNIPSDVIKYYDEDVVISNLIPELNGYTFMGWSTDAKATSADTKYNRGATITDRKDLNLYAVWKKNSTTTEPTTKPNPNNNLPENPNTGIENYLLPVVGVSFVSLLGLILIKKKNTFVRF